MTRYLLLLVAFAMPSVSTAQGNGDTLTVGVMLFPPFVEETSSGAYEGFTIDLLESIENETGLRFEYRAFANTSSILDAVRDSVVDLGAAGITITDEREQELDFTHPYFQSGLGILITEKHNWFQDIIYTVKVVLETLYPLLIALVLFVLLSAHVLLYFERGHGITDRDYVDELIDTTYYIIVTMSTVGYGDITPKRRVGKLFSITLILFGVGFFGVFIAKASSAFTLHEVRTTISGPEDLTGKRVATEIGTTSSIVLEELGARVVETRTIDDAYQQLQEGDVQAVVFDHPVITHYANSQGGDTGLVTTGDLFNEEYYGIALPQGSPYREILNSAILRIEREGELSQLYSEYFE